jgi:hypothetical protein
MRAARFWLVLALIPATALAQSDADGSAQEAPVWQEAGYTLPARPDERDLRAVHVNGSAPGRFLLDSKSLAVGEDGVVRYVLVVRSSGGGSNATFEGIRCNTSRHTSDAEKDVQGTGAFHDRGGLGEAMPGKSWLGELLQSSPQRRFYASAGQDGDWHPFKNSDWRPLGDSSRDPRVALAIGYFCDGPAVRTRDEILARLRGDTRVDFMDPRAHP